LSKILSSLFISVIGSLISFVAKNKKPRPDVSGRGFEKEFKSRPVNTCCGCQFRSLSVKKVSCYIHKEDNYHTFFDYNTVHGFFASSSSHSAAVQAVDVYFQIDCDIPGSCYSHHYMNMGMIGNCYRSSGCHFYNDHLTEQILRLQDLRQIKE
jgi:hypothetical protein